MATQFIVNEKGEKTAVLLSLEELEELEEYEKLINQHKQYELTDDYKLMMDEMLAEEENGTAKYISHQEIENRFLSL